MTAFAVNILMAVIWTALTGRLDLANFALGIALGAVALFLSRGLWGGSGYFRRIWRSLALIAWALIELIAAALVEAAEACRIGTAPRAVLVEVPITIDRDSEIALLSSLISLSPRTLVIGVAPDRSKLIVQTTPKRRPALEGHVKRLLERHILEVMR